MLALLRVNSLIWSSLISLLILLLSWGCQSRAISRVTGTALNLELPNDFEKPISFASGRKGEKDLFYWTKDGQMKVKTYTDFGVLESEIIFIDKW